MRKRGKRQGGERWLLCNKPEEPVGIEAGTECQCQRQRAHTSDTKAQKARLETGTGEFQARPGAYVARDELMRL